MTKDTNALPAPAFSLPATAKMQQLHDDAVRHLSNNPPDWLDAASLLDLHIHELPIATSCLDMTLGETDLVSCLKDDVLTVYAVPRPVSLIRSAEPTGRVGMNDFFTAGPHWQTEVPQSDRGVAMFLSSLRVFAHLLKSSSISGEHRDRVIYVFDLLCSFPPAVRALHLLVQGRTITRLACAALSQAFYCILEDLGHKKLIKNDNARLFEGARLVLGLIMEKANQLKSTNFVVPVYSLHIHKVQFQTSAPAAFPHLMPVDGPSSRPATSTYVQPDAGSGEMNLVLLSESNQNAVIFNPPDDLFARVQSLHEVVSPVDLRNLHQLANLCGKVSLSVVRPSLLSSVAPEHLTFDAEGHVAVYTGKAGCAAPGEDTVLFRPMHGEETPNVGHVEQQLAPILQIYEQDGTCVFDVLGSSQTRALAEPDEIVMFAVDCSASMTTSSDLVGIDHNEDTVQEPDVYEISPDVYTKVKLDETKRWLSEHEAYADVIGVVVDSALGAKSVVAAKMLRLIFDLLIDQLGNLHKESSLSHWQRRMHDKKIKELETFAAGLKRFDQELVDIVILGAMAVSPQKWTWRLGQQLPGRSQIPALPNEVTLVPAALRCPIRLDLIEDPVMAADGQIYGRQAITKWMSYKRSSPLTGLMLSDTELTPDGPLAERADKWLQAEDLVEPVERPVSKRRRTSPRHNTMTFSNSSHHFTRTLPPTTTLLDLFKVAFRGMKGRHNAFQLLCQGVLLQPTANTIASSGISGGSFIAIVVADDANTVPNETVPLCLIKVYSNYSHMAFAYWVPRDTDNTFMSVVTKYWRFQWTSQPWLSYTKQEVWAGLASNGDNHYLGTLPTSAELLRDYLTAYHAFGSLHAEPVYRNQSTGLSDSHGSDSEEDDEEDSKPLVLKLHISQVSTRKKSERRLSRLEVLKQCFEAIVNRMIAYSYKTHIGLVTFDSSARVAQSITHVIENFRRSVANMRATGDTALWDALKLAQTQIMKHAEKYPQAQRRIICLSDGDDNKSVAGVADLCFKLREDKIAVDSICIGNDDNMDLKALSIMLRSYCFYPRILTSALAICEMEPFLSQTERPAPEVATADLPRTSALNNFYITRNRAEFTVVTQDVFPKRKEHPRLEDTFIQLSNSVRSNAGTQSRLPTLRASRLLVEMREIAADPHPMYDCYVSESDMFFWKVVMQGPPETPYENCNFMLYLEMPDNFPAFPPKGRFVTNVFHPNIDRHGRICHSIFDRDWTTDTTLKSVLDTVYGLLLQAEAGDAVHTTVTLGFHHDEVAFAEEARRHARKHGSKSREDWKYELLEIDDEDDEDHEGEDEEDL
ncbi:hypothetical protein M436DRAFT_38338 [Aureobasidium namibiae CBS 147.97]|uniref:peptidylprolyl isomerase n=1 Tax=Aureobasidium namibiae CBS 147.97 TaxID=1043004 RepID=A0A074WXZ8_9PEZI|nr:uncharacterized protein M436DRAFT_38338 [Aureobasidium namibiae CBS 147.97]KEQ76394.1 hypothetical protein M436DRAFT_38338 [Aureobasidium namibiae CBS 147.97]